MFRHPLFTFSTPICFEDSFPNDVRLFVLVGAQVILNISNDYWSLTDTEAMQHAANAVFRVVENGRPLARAAASGLTCLVDSLGRITARAPLYEPAVLVVDVPLPPDAHVLREMGGLVSGPHGRAAPPALPRGRLRAAGSAIGSAAGNATGNERIVSLAVLAPARGLWAAGMVAASEHGRREGLRFPGVSSRQVSLAPFRAGKIRNRPRRDPDAEHGLDKRRNGAGKTFPGWIDASRAAAGCPSGPVGRLIRSSGYFNQKAKKLKAAAVMFSRAGALSPRGAPSREELLALWGVGRETADSILLYAFCRPAFVVDAYTRRIFQRLGLLEGSESYDEVQQRFHKHLPRSPEIYNEMHALIVEHAKRHCSAKPQCAGCPISRSCRYFRSSP